MAKTRFEWDAAKDHENQLKHAIGFTTAQFAFADPQRVIAVDTAHSSGEVRHFCFGRVGGGILTVRFTYRRRRHTHLRRGLLAKGQAHL